MYINSFKLYIIYTLLSITLLVLFKKYYQKFARWKAYIIHHRENELDLEHTRRLKVELKIHGRKIEQMQLLIDREKEKSALEKSKYSMLLRQVHEDEWRGIIENKQLLTASRSVSRNNSVRGSGVSFAGDNNMNNTGV